ncbi:MAG TPA: hypothetical protein VLW85_14045 [Myxococcales bacterium]|nr:hypothetical protein [Myxococcales bacterium]
MRKLALLLLLSCATVPKDPNAPPDTEVSVLDETGDPIMGSVSFYSRNGKDECNLSASSCNVAVPAGDYSFTFRKERAGRTGAAIGGMVQSERGAGCLRARVHVVPGQKITCKKTSEYNCGKGIYGNMDCGLANASKYGYTPRPEDEPPQQ